MKSKPDANIRARRTTLYVTLVFLVLAVSLQVLAMFYWNRTLEPRLRREAASQADVLAHSQAVRLADAILDTSRQRLRSLNETIDEILLFTGSASDEPLFLGLALEIDYDVVDDASAGSLDLQLGVDNCQDCFVSEVGLYSPLSDELIGIARFHVSDRLYRALSTDVKRTLLTQSGLGIVLLIIVWAAVMFLIRAINSSRRQAEAANRAKSTFLANMSHELRTPLNAIIGFSELMGFDVGLSKKQRENLAIINRSGEYLLELINDVLELSKIEIEAAGNTLTETAFDLYDVLEKVTEMIRLRAEKKNLQLVFERSDNVPRFIKTDERKLRQILLNLLGNAVKFTEEGGVTLRVRMDTAGKGENGDDVLLLSFEVADSGPGIASEDASRIFEAFTQAQSGYDKKEGTGLGLAISRQFVRHLGGDIGVDSNNGKGAVFNFTVRVKPADAGETASFAPMHRVLGIKSSKEGARREPYRILVVDDNAENRTLLRLLLERVGFSVETAGDGRQAVELSEKTAPHLIWMDMRMPVMDGYEATKKIRRMGGPSPVIIALTASAFNEDRDAVLAAGCDDFVRRPFRESEIFNKIRQHLGVEFIYEIWNAESTREASSPGLSIPDIRSAIARLPRHVVAELKTAIELSDMDQMAGMVSEIGKADGELGAALKTLVDAFQFDRLLAILCETGDVSGEPPGENQ